MDILFRPMFRDNPQVATLYVAFEEGNLYRRYPAVIVEADRSYVASSRPRYYSFYLFYLLTCPPPHTHTIFLFTKLCLLDKTLLSLFFDLQTGKSSPK